MNNFKYSDSNKRYYQLDYYYKHKFNCKVAKISLDAGFTCPNKDGTKGLGGCIYCSKLGSGDFAGNKNDGIITQFNKIKEMISNKWKNTKYIGYFQANTNTYASVSKLKEVFEPIIKLENVLGIAIATRSDCLDNAILDYLEDINKRCYLSVELGLQTINKKTNKLLNRCESLEEFENAVKNLRKRNIEVVIHIINSLPYEKETDMLNTVKYLNKLDIQGIKIHMLHIIKNTKLEKLYKEKPFKLLTKDEYIDIVIKQIELLKENIFIHRLTGDPNKEELIEPIWTIKKIDVLNGIDKEMKKRDTYQGIKS